MNDLEKKLHKERKDREAKVAKVRQLETELREIKSDVGQKSEIGKSSSELYLALAKQVNSCLTVL